MIWVKQTESGIGFCYTSKMQNKIYRVFAVERSVFLIEDWLFYVICIMHLYKCNFKDKMYEQHFTASSTFGKLDPEFANVINPSAFQRPSWHMYIVTCTQFRCEWICTLSSYQIKRKTSAWHEWYIQNAHSALNPLHPNINMYTVLCRLPIVLTMRI